jgi:hypothetical protein
MRQINLKSVAGWDKLTPKQLQMVAKIAMMPNYEKSFATKVFLKLNGLRVKPGMVITKTDDDRYYKSNIFQMNWRRQFTISTNIFASMVRRFDWLEEPITLFRCLPKINRYPASDYRLYSVTLEQFLFADNIYNAFTLTRQIKYLRQLTAIFYHPKNEKFNTSKVVKRSMRFTFTKRHQLYATYLWYTGVKRWIMSKYPYLFSGSGSGSTTPPDEVIMGILSSLNKGDITKNETLLKTHVHEALHQLNIMAEKVENHV